MRLAIPKGAAVAYDEPAASPPAMRPRMAIPSGAEVNFDEPAPEAEKPGLVETAARGLAQGATFGFADELSGALESAFTDKTYRQARDEARARYKAAEEAHPIGYKLSQILGGAATGLGTAGLAAKAAAAGTKAVAGLAAAEGAAGAVGESEKEGAGELASEAAHGAAVGGLLGAGLHKVFSGYIGNAVERRAKHLTEDIGEGAVPTVRRRLGAVTKLDQNEQSLAVNVLDSDPEFMKALKAGKKEALAVARERAEEHGATVGPIYRELDKATGGVRIGDVREHFEQAMQGADRPGNERVVEALGEARDNFVDWARRTHTKVVPGQTISDDVHVPSQDVREWVSGLLKHSQRSMGGLNETEAKIVKNEIHQTAHEFLRQHIAEVAERNPTLAPKAAELLEANKRARVFSTVAETLKAGLERQNWKPQSLKDLLGHVGLPGVAGLAAAGGDLISGGAAAVGTKLAMSAAKKLDRSATLALATLVRAARAGGASEQMKLDAIKAGVPIQLVDTIMTQARGLGGQEETSAAIE